MKNWRLQWLHDETGEWRTQLQNDNRAKFDKAVADLVATSEREGGWMNGTQWRIAEFDMRQVGLTEFLPNAANHDSSEAR